MRFWDREKEIGYLSRYIRSEPNAILFVYGPKSSGKSTLLMKVVEGMRDMRMRLYWYDLRGKLISDYSSVVDLFFRERKWGRKVVEALSGLLNFDVSVFELSSEELRGVLSKELDAFELMEEVLSGNRSEGVVNVIVFDEVQKLKGVYMNSPNNQRELIRELFNFFVRVSKVLHISHVIVMTSDTFFIERVYSDSTLENTSVFYSVDYFDDEVALDILVSEGLSEGEASYVVEWCGGVPWMMERVLLEGDVRGVVCGLYKQKRSKILEFLINYDRDKEAREVLSGLLEGKLEIKKGNMDVIRDLVSKEILYYDPIEVDVRFQTKLDKKAAMEVLG